MTEKKEKKKETKEKEKVKKTENPGKKIPVLAILIVVVVFASIIGGIFIQKAKNFIEGDVFSRLTKGVVDIGKDGEKVTVTTEEGGFVFEEEGELPNEFPSDFPIYPEAKLISSWLASGESTDGLSLIWETEDTFSKVSNYYENELEEANWTLSFTSETEDSTTFAFEKNGSSGFIGITFEESKVVISLTLSL